MRLTLSLLVCLLGFYGLFGAHTTLHPLALNTQEKVMGLTVYRYDLQGKVNMILESTQGLLSTHPTILQLSNPILQILTARGPLHISAHQASAQDFHFPFVFSVLTLEKELNLKLGDQGSIAQLSADTGTWDVHNRTLEVKGTVQGQYKHYTLAATQLCCTQTVNQTWDTIQASTAKISDLKQDAFYASSDRMSFMSDSGLVSLEGNVKLLQAQQEMVAEHLLFDLHSQTVRSAPGAAGKSKLIILQ